MPVGRGSCTAAARTGGSSPTPTTSCRCRPVDVVHGHHYTSTFPTSIFRQMLMVAGHAGDRHLTLTESTVTVRRAGAPTEHRAITVAELPALLHELRVPLDDDELERLLERVGALEAPAG